MIGSGPHALPFYIQHSPHRVWALPLLGLGLTLSCSKSDVLAQHLDFFSKLYLGCLHLIGQAV